MDGIILIPYFLAVDVKKTPILLYLLISRYKVNKFSCILKLSSDAVLLFPCFAIYRD